MRMQGMQDGSVSRLFACLLFLMVGTAGAQTFYWNPSAPVLGTGTVGDAQRAYNWTSEPTGGGSHPKSNRDDDFTADALDPAWTKIDKDGFNDTPDNPYVNLTVAANQLTLRARGADLWMDTNQFAGVYRSDITGDFDVSVKVVSQSNPQHWAKAGIMMRNSFTGTDSAGFAIVAVTPGHGFIFQCDVAGKAGELEFTFQTGTVTANSWLRLAKRGPSVTAYYKTAVNAAWTPIGTAQTLQAMAANSKIALFANSHTIADTSTAVFDDFTGGGDIASATADLNFGGGTSAQAGLDARLGASLSVRSVTFAGAKVGFDFLASTLTLSDTANFAAAKAVAAGTGALVFGAGNQKLTPRLNTALPAISKSGTGTLTLAGSSLSAGKLTLSGGSVNCGGRNQEFAGLNATGGSILGLDPEDTLTFSGTANFAGLSTLPASGTIQVSAVSGPVDFTPGTASFNHLILWPRPLAANARIAVKGAALGLQGNLILRDEKIAGGSGFAGDVDFKAGSPDVTLDGSIQRADAGAAAGVSSLRLDMGKGTWSIAGDVVLALPAGLAADSATLDFRADAPIVQNLSVGAAVLGALRHSGTGTLNLAQAAQKLNAVSFSQSSGILNLNGSDFSVAGNFSVSNGSSGSIAGLGGREIKAGGNIALSGTSTARLGLSPGTAWKATAGGTLIADWADLGKSDATGSAAAGAATANCTDNGGNVRWNFQAALPSFVLQPTSKEVVAGKPVVFSAKASGGGDITYAWRKQGDTAILSSKDILEFPKVDASQNGAHYYCTATNSIGSVESLDAVLTVDIPPAIDAQPGDSSVVLGQPVSFTVAARGTVPLQYAWRRTGDAATVWGTGPTLSLDATTAAQDGYTFACTITNPYGNVVSRAAKLTLKFPPKITRQPGNLIVTSGQKATFTIGATGTGTLAYAWTRLGDTAVVSTDSSLVLGPLALADSEVYVCKVSNLYGSATSQPAKLSVVEAATIVREPADVTTPPGRKVTFNAGVAGAKPLAFAWRKKGDTTVIGRDTSLVLDSVKVAANGSIFVFTVSNAYGADTSREAKLTVIACDSVFKVTPETLTVDEGQPAVLVGKSACSVGRLWSVVSGPGPRILDPEADTLAFTAPRLDADTAIVLKFSAQYGGSWVAKQVVVKVREAIPDPKFTLPVPGKWKSTRTYVIRPALSNGAALKASKYAPPLRYQWFLSAPIVDSVQAGDSLTLSRPTQGGNLEVTLCMDNGGASGCLVHTVQIDQASVSLAVRAARFGPISLQGRILAWNSEADVRVWDFRGRVLWRGHGIAGGIASLPEAAARDLLGGRARLEILAPSARR
jgi:hypothetical protein